MKNLFHKNQQITAQQGRMVQKQASLDFLDPAHEWRRIFAETWGTFLLVLVAAGGGVVAARSGGAVTLGMEVIAPGMMVMVIIYFMGTVSGAHLNPAVTLAFALRRNFPWSRVPAYVLAQLFGGVAAAEFLHVMFGLRSTQHRQQRCHCGGRIHCFGGHVGCTDQWRLNEPSPFVRARSGARRSGYDMDIHRRAGAGGADRCCFRVDTQGETHRCGSDCCAGYTR